MDVELATDLLMREALAELDPKAKGAFIEVGLGSGNYSFLWAQKAGFKCYGVEPVPTLHLKRLAAARNVDLTEAAIAGESGEVSIYLGILNGFTVPDLSSLHADWWGGSKITKLVPALTFREYLERKNLKTVSCLKVDTEGSELSIITSILELDETTAPRLVVFEYGGGGIKASGLGGWKPAFFEGTLECLAVLKRAGYGCTAIIDGSARRCRVLELQAVADFKSLFPDTAEVGNILCIRGSGSLERLKSLCRRIAPRLAIANCFNKSAFWYASVRWNCIVRPIRGLTRRFRSLLRTAPKVE